MSHDEVWKDENYVKTKMPLSPSYNFKNSSPPRALSKNLIGEGKVNGKTLNNRT